MAVDATMRKLTIPPGFVPYLERMKIYDLFYELGNLLGANMPEDHVLFLRNTLVHMNETRNKPRLLLLTPPFMDRQKIVNLIASKTGQAVIPRSLITKNDPQMDDVKKLADNINTYIAENDILKNGWILYDYPNSNDEAMAMLRGGTVPTHTFLFIPLSKTKTSKYLWIENLDQWTTSEVKDTWNKYQRVVQDFRHTFRETFIEVNILCKTLEQIMERCTRLLKEFPVRGPPVIPRVLLIGTRGCRRGELVKLLHERLGLTPVDMSELIEEAKLGTNDISEQIKFLDMKKVPIYASIILKLLQDRLLQEDCLTKGWVLIRFPRSKADLLAIDGFDTPPNRIIFLSTNCDDAFQRLREIRIQKYSGYVDSKTEIEKRGIYLEGENYFIHPTDDEKRILLEHEKFSSSYQEMVDYCGEDCAIVNGSGRLEEVVERIENVIGKGTTQIGAREGSLNHKLVCQEDNWSLVQGDTQQEVIDPVTSSTYMFQNVLRRPKKRICPTPEASESSLQISNPSDYLANAFEQSEEISIPLEQTPNYSEHGLSANDFLEETSNITI